MPHIRTTVHAGMTWEIWEGHTWNCGKVGLRREKRKKPTPEEQIRENRKQRERKVRLLLNHNFSPGDLYLTLSYKIRPAPDQMKKDMDIFLRKLRKHYRNNGQELKYLYVFEIGKRGARHVHMVLSDLKAGMTVRELKQFWQQGFMDVKALDDTGDYSALAAYLMKYVERTNEVMGSDRKGYSPSRNLTMPELVRTVLKRDKLPAEPFIPPRLRGKVYVQKDSFRCGISKVTGFPYVEYRLVEYMRPRKQREPACTVTLDSKREDCAGKHHKKDGKRICSKDKEVP